MGWKETSRSFNDNQHEKHSIIFSKLLIEEPRLLCTQDNDWKSQEEDLYLIIMPHHKNESFKSYQQTFPKLDLFSFKK